MNSLKSSRAARTFQETKDASMNNVGGIDLNAKQLRLQETGGQIDFYGQVDAAMLGQQIDGFSPVVLGVTPLSNPQGFFEAVRN